MVLSKNGKLYELMCVRFAHFEFLYAEKMMNHLKFSLSFDNHQTVFDCVARTGHFDSVAKHQASLEKTEFGTH